MGGCDGSYRSFKESSLKELSGGSFSLLDDNGGEELSLEGMEFKTTIRQLNIKKFKAFVDAAGNFNVQRLTLVGKEKREVLKNKKTRVTNLLLMYFDSPEHGNISQIFPSVYLIDEKGIMLSSDSTTGGGGDGGETDEQDVQDFYDTDGEFTVITSGVFSQKALGGILKHMPNISMSLHMNSKAPLVLTCTLSTSSEIIFLLAPFMDDDHHDDDHHQQKHTGGGGGSGDGEGGVDLGIDDE